MMATYIQQRTWAEEPDIDFLASRENDASAGDGECHDEDGDGNTNLGGKSS